MRRPQKTRKLGYHQRASVEHEGYDEVRSTSCVNRGNKMV